MPRVTAENLRLLSRLFYVAASNIPNAGQGVFAKIDIPKGTFMGEYQGRVVRTQKEMESDYTFGLTGDDGSEVEVRDGRTVLKFLNHEGRWPNAEFDGYNLYSKRDIKAGDEVKFHYGMPLSQILAAHNLK